MNRKEQLLTDLKVENTDGKMFPLEEAIIANVVCF
jgi:hypothetical protein